MSGSTQPDDQTNYAFLESMLSSNMGTVTDYAHTKTALADAREFDAACMNGKGIDDASVTIEHTLSHGLELARVTLNVSNSSTTSIGVLVCTETDGLTTDVVCGKAPEHTINANTQCHLVVPSVAQQQLCLEQVTPATPLVTQLMRRAQIASDANLINKTFDDDMTVNMRSQKGDATQGTFIQCIKVNPDGTHYVHPFAHIIHQISMEQEAILANHNNPNNKTASGLASIKDLHERQFPYASSFKTIEECIEYYRHPSVGPDGREMTSTAGPMFYLPIKLANYLREFVELSNTLTSLSGRKMKIKVFKLFPNPVSDDGILDTRTGEDYDARGKIHIGVTANFA